MNCQRTLGLTFAIALLASPLAHAAIIAASPTVLIVSPPPDARTGQLESDTEIRAWYEQQHLTLDHDIDVNITLPGTYSSNALTPGTISAGTLINSYFLHFDNVGSPSSAVGITGSVTFDSDILGIITGDQRLDATDLLPGLPTTLYAAGDSARGLEAGGNAIDSLTLSADRRTVTLDLLNIQNSDDIRVITAVPEPSAFILTAVALVTLLGWRFRRARASARVLMTFGALLATALGPAPTAVGATIQFVNVGNPGNAADTTGYGAVGYSYEISKYEITNAQYAEFLNLKDPAGNNTLGLYNQGLTFPFSRIEYRPELANGLKYRVAEGANNLPVTWIDWYNAARFANWLNNGQGNADTESGAYTLLGGTHIPANATSITRNPGTRIALPSENEWYKAAYYDPSTGNYFLYPTSSNSAPISSPPTNALNAANYFGDVTPVGSYSGTTSPYGLFDMAGNVDEWNETLAPSSSFRGVRTGAALLGNANLLRSTSRGDYAASLGSHFIGFRVVSVPEPSTALLTLAALATIGVRRLLRHKSI